MARPPDAQPDASGGSETVLLVEDEDAVRALAAHALRLAGYRVIAAASGCEALERSAGLDGRVHVLVTDVVMPGMNGRELAERLTSTRPDTRVLFVSGYAGDSVFERGDEVRGSAFLSKPFTPASLVAKVREVLDSPVA